VERPFCNIAERGLFTVTSTEGIDLARIALLTLLTFSPPLLADWSTVPDLGSSTLWQLVAENRAEVVSSVGYGSPEGFHIKQTVFRVLNADKAEGDIRWAVDPNGGFRPVMCIESWQNTFKYRGSSCSIPGCEPDTQECLDSVTKNL
jgi:hypothetical protein